MDYLMKLVTTALEWSHQAGEIDVRAETLQAAASLLMLRRDTLRIIDGAGPSVEAPQSEPPAQERVSGTEVERVSFPAEHPEKPTSAVTERTDMVDQAPSTQDEHATSRDAVGNQKQLAKPTKCTFSGVVPIEPQRFLAGSVALVECPDCARTRTLSPRNGVLRFPSHDKRKTTTPNTEQRWAMINLTWGVVGGEKR